MTETKFCAGYIRVSTDKQEELSPASQLKELKKYASANGYILLPEYTFIEEEGISGKRADKRPAFQQMIATAKTTPKPFDAILVWKFSRFARNQDEAAFYKGMLRKKYNIDVLSVSEPIMEGMYGRLIEMIIEWNDEFYSYNLSGEVMRGMKEKAVRGGYQAQTPMGYDMKDGIPVPNQDAPIIKNIFADYLSGKSQFVIACELNKLGIKTKKGNQFRPRSITYILENPFYMGKVRWNRQHHETHTIKAKEEWIISDGIHEPLISEDDFNSVQEQLIIRKRKRARPIGHTKHWLSSMLKCSDCGRSLAIQYYKNAPGWQCSGYNHGLCTVSHHIKSDFIEKSIVNKLRVILDSDNIQYTSIIKSSSDTAAIIETLEKSLDNISKKEERIKRAYRDGIDTLEEYKESKTLLEAEKQDLISRIEEAKRSVSKENIDDYKLTIKSVCDIIESDNYSYEQKANSFRSIVDHVVYDKKTESIDIFLINYK
ncbi:MAG: recombinase family protein [Lachnospiraceae bacterium]|nr:recombinase family protein [Lachnospiraceae bacterium]